MAQSHRHHRLTCCASLKTGRANGAMHREPPSEFVGTSSLGTHPPLVYGLASDRMFEWKWKLWFAIERKSSPSRYNVLPLESVGIYLDEGSIYFVYKAVTFQSSNAG